MAGSNIYQALIALGMCLLWLFSSSSIIVVNRCIMVEKQFSYPLAVAAMGQVVCAIFCTIYCNILRLVPPAKGVDTKTYLLSVIPVGACQALVLWLGNAIYLHLTVSFIEMARASTPVVTMLALWLAGLESPSARAARAVLLTAAGCAIAALGEVHLTAVGAALMCANLACEALRMVMTQYLLVNKSLHPMQTLKLISPVAAATLLAGSMLTEAPAMRAAGHGLATVRASPLLFLAAACFGLVINVLSTVIIKQSSAVTLKVLAAVRGPLVVVLGVLLFSEGVSLLKMLGYGASLIGFVLYNVYQLGAASAAATAAATVGTKAGEEEAEGLATGAALSLQHQSLLRKPPAAVDVAFGATKEDLVHVSPRQWGAAAAAV